MAVQRIFPSYGPNISNEIDREFCPYWNTLPTRLLRLLSLAGIELFRIDEVLVERKLRNIEASKSWHWVDRRRLQEVIRVQAK
jgi:hypothetical protein